MFIILALIRGHFCVYASVRVEVQLFICSSTALFGLEFAATSPQVQECVQGWALCAGGQQQAILLNRFAIPSHMYCHTRFLFVGSQSPNIHILNIIYLGKQINTVMIPLHLPSFKSV